MRGWKVLYRSGRTVSLSNYFNRTGSVALPVVHLVFPLHSEKRISSFISGDASLSEYYFEILRETSLLGGKSCIYPALNNDSGQYVPLPRLSELTRSAVSRTRDTQKIHGIAAEFGRSLQTLEPKIMGEEQCRKDCKTVC